VHLHVLGEEVENNQVELGIYFYPEDYVPQNRTVLQFLNASGRAGSPSRRERSLVRSGF